MSGLKTKNIVFVTGAFMNSSSWDDWRLYSKQKTAARGGLTSAAKVDFKNHHPPLLITSGSEGTIIPVHLNMRNYKRYVPKAPSWITRSFPIATILYRDNPRGEKMRTISSNGLTSSKLS